MVSALESLKIVLLSITAAVVYGIVHDQITARICVEYFTIGHPQLFTFEIQDPTLLGIGWGVVATWWVGVLLGLPAAAAARLGSWPKRDARWLLKPIAVLMVVSACGAVLAGLVGWWLASRNVVFLVGPLADEVPPEKHVSFLIDAFAHSASYGCGFLGGVVLIGYILISRGKEAARARAQLPTPPAAS
jgi:hypothetical protein